MNSKVGERIAELEAKLEQTKSPEDSVLHDLFKTKLEELKKEIKESDVSDVKGGISQEEITDFKTKVAQMVKDFEGRLSPEEIAEIEAEVAEMIKDAEEPMTAEELFQSKANSLIEHKQTQEKEKRAQQELVIKEYRQYVADLKKKLKNHAKKQLVEIIAKQAWEYNQLQHMARHLHEELLKLTKGSEEPKQEKIDG